MKGGKRPLGYTIIEVMIVLAVSGIMFLIAASFINGRQEKTSFSQGTNEMASRLQDVITQVTDGQYSDVPLNCSTLGGSIAFGGVPNGQGTNPDCIFLGKVLHFSVNNVTHDYEVISVAGSRLDSTGNQVQDLGIGPHGAFAQYIPSLTVQQIVPQNLDVAEVQVVDSAGTTQYSCGIGFMQSLASINSVTGILNNQAQAVSMFYVSGLNNNQSGDTSGGGGEHLIYNGLAAAKSVKIYVTDGTRSADIDVGTNGTSNNGAQLSVTVNVDSGTVPGYSGTTLCP